jgi:mannose-6-phosphate isomerase-like protein (cupin superfamily)
MAEFTGMKEAVDTWRFKRIVVEANEKGKSHIVTEKVSNVISRPNFIHRADIWCAKEVPVDNSIPGDRALDQNQREPFPGGLVCRSLILWPDNPDKEAFIKSAREIHQSVKQKHMPTEEDYQRHPNMHRTDTLDLIAIVEGEIYLVTDEDETLMRPGDVCVIKGVNHAWANRSDKPCVTIGVMLDAKALS